MAKRRALEAALSKRSRHIDLVRSSSPSEKVKGPFISGDGFPKSAFDIVLCMLSNINDECVHYNYQVCLPGQKLLYQGIGTFSTLLGLDESEAFDVLIKSSLIYVDKNSKAHFRIKQWKSITEQISGCDFENEYSRKRVFIFGIGVLGKKMTIAKQCKKVRAPSKLSELYVKRQDDFKLKWKAFMPVDTHMPNDENWSPSDEDAGCFQASPCSSHHSKSTGWELHYDSDDTKPLRKKTERMTMLGNRLHKMPAGWKGTHRLRLSYLQEQEKVVKAINKAATNNQCHPTDKQRIIIGTFAARWPNVSDTAIEQLLSAGGIQLACQTKLLQFDGNKSILEFDNIVEGLEPSRTSITNNVIFTAAHRVIVNAQRLAKAKKVYLGCDKGGGVLIKMAFFWDLDLGEIVELNLDFDKSGDKARDGGIAIEHSLQKYTFGNREWKIAGGSSDSGGGFTGIAMKKALADRQLVDNNAYIHIHCTHHNDQTNLRNAILTVFGSGGKDKRNVCQLVHAFSDMQKLFDKNEIHPIMKWAWHYVKGEHVEIPMDLLTLMQEPILT